MVDTSLPQPGALVRVRSRQYLVEELTPRPDPSSQTLVRLSCLDDDSQGTSLEVLWESEVDAQILQAATWQDVARKGFDPPSKFSAYLHTLRWNSVTSTNARLFQSPLRAGIQVMTYQLEPLRKALQLPRVNLFIADDVGLGKTIEAGLILRELLMRQKVRSVVVACPPSVMLQWRDELENRFGLTFVVFDRDYVLRRRQERGYGVNPWTTHTRFIISHALLRDETYAGALRDWLRGFSPGSLLILDEAHNAAPASGARYAIDSYFTRVVRDISQRFEHRLFLSATPHNGHSNSFAALLEILDPQRFCRGVPVKGPKLLEQVMVRRLKEDLRQISGGFPRRNVVPVPIDGLPTSAPELRLAELLAEYRDARENRLRDAPKSVQTASGLVTTSLQKRLFSSVEAFAFTLDVHRRAFDRKAAQPVPMAASEQLSKENHLLLVTPPGPDDERSELSESEVSEEEQAQIEAATKQSLSVSDAAKQDALLEKEKSFLEQMSKLAHAERGNPDARVRWLVDWIRKNMCPELPPLGKTVPQGKTPAWNGRRIIIFTEYTDTKRYLEQQLRSAIAFTDNAEARIATFHGGMADKTREEIKQAFNTDPKKHPLRMLIATDAAREGVNLQNHCADLFHFDIPWNPSRMEQRNGRIDRKLQRAPEVNCYYFVYKQRPEDRVLQVIAKKTEVIQLELGSLSPVIETRMNKGIRRQDVERLAKEIETEKLSQTAKETVEEELESVRERRELLQTQLVELQDLLSKSQDDLAFSEPHFRDSLSCALEILGADPLKPVTSKGESTEVPRWRFPELDRRTGADSTWADTLDTLRAPRRKDQKFWEWRKDAPIRPVVFKNTGTLDDDAVQLHLEHRVVRRLLNRFLTQGFVDDDLSRACVSHTQDAIPRVILIGRLSLYGPHAARLHDEVIAVAARWLDPSVRKEPLKPYADESESKTLDLLEKSLGSPELHSVPKEVTDRFVKSAPRDVQELLGHLQKRAENIAKSAEEKLLARGEREAKDMTEIIQAQRKRIQAAFESYEKEKQMPLAFEGMNELEISQKESDHRYWQKRLAASEQELVREPVRIREGYVVKARRIEPVGLVYLWPVSS